MKSLRPDELLAVEPGGTEVETRRHHEFRDDHVDHPQGTEWFAASLFLYAHIVEVNSKYVVPTLADLGVRRMVRQPCWHPEFAEYDLMTDDELIELMRRSRSEAKRAKQNFLDGLVELSATHGWTVTRIGCHVGMSFSQVARHIRQRKVASAGEN